MRKIKSPAAALGETVGRLVEEAIRKAVEEIVKSYGLKISETKRLKDIVGVEFEIDMPILKDEKLVALIDVKYLKYKKHARDKGSWVVVAHSRLRATYPEIKRSLVILAGPGWTKGAVRMISTSCIDVISLDPKLVNDIFAEYEINLMWEEKNAETPKISWERLQKLLGEEEKLEEIKKRIIEKSGIKGLLEQWFKRYVLEADPEEKIPLPYICPEAGGRWRRLNEFISGTEPGSP
jgi:hypothetical protein